MEHQNNFPRQKLSRREKNEEWAKACVDSGLGIVGLYDNTRRSPKWRKLRNYALYNGILDKTDLEYVCNPLGLDNLELPANLQYYDIVSPIFNLLFGEEAKRPFNFIIRAINEDVISDKEKKQKELIIQMLEQMLMAHIDPESVDPENPPPTPEELQKYISYEYQDMRESIATKIVQYFRRYLNLDMLFLKGWEDSLIAGEEIYCVDIVADEPSVRRVNPTEIYCTLNPNSDNIDDSDIIVEETWMSIGQVIDTFYDSLSKSDIDLLEEWNGNKNALNKQLLGYTEPYKLFIQREEDVLSGKAAQANFDEANNVRVCKVVWKSRRKVGKLTFLDENGEQQELLVDELYKHDKEDPDSSIEWLWINEYWEGTKIGTDIYVNMRPRPVQFRRMDNISICKSGYVGTIYNANNSQSISLMDRLIPWIYLYVVIWYRTELLLAANQGKIAKVDLAMIPEGWEIDKWLYYATSMKFAFVDSFKEGKKGAATGKLAGNMSGQSGELNLETGNQIQGYISLLEFVEQKLYNVSGVTPQRMGAVSSSELVGNVERAVVQSAHITEKWFTIHNDVKKRVVETLVETAKYIISEGKTKKFQYITDDLATVFFSVDGELFNDAEYGVFLTNSSKDHQAIETLKQLSHAAMQNDQIALSDIISIFNSESLADIKNKLIQAEQRRQQEMQAQQQQQQQAQAQMQQDMIAFEREKMDRDDWNKEADRQTKIQVAEIAAFNRQSELDTDGNGIPDPVELAKLSLEERRFAFEQQQSMNQDMIDRDRANLEREKIKTQKEIKEKEIEAKKQIAKNKPKPKK